MALSWPCLMDLTLAASSSFAARCTCERAVSSTVQMFAICQQAPTFCWSTDKKFRAARSVRVLQSRPWVCPIGLQWKMEWSNPMAGLAMSPRTVRAI